MASSQTPFFLATGAFAVTAHPSPRRIEVESAPVEIHVEERRADTRADIVLRIGHQTVVFEATVVAGEQPRQADRLHEYWASEQPTLVFLTRAGRAPYAAKKRADQWATVTWRDIAQLARAVTASAGLDPSPGAREFSKRLELYKMTPDAVQFYVRHRVQTSEWVKLEKRVDDLVRGAVKDGDLTRRPSC